MPIQAYIERREKFLCERDTERTSLPFDWGLEHLGLPDKGDPARALREFSQRVLQNSDEFYWCPPCRPDDYQFDGELLRFPSAVQTAFPENNQVWGRYFPASKNLALVVYPQFNANWEGHVALCKLLRLVGITTLRLSPPYHHFRKPKDLIRPEYLVSANLGRTLAATRQGVLDVRRATDWLFARGYKRVGFVGTSVGALLGFLAMVHDPRLCMGSFIHISPYYSDVVWHGMTTAHIRCQLETRVTLQELRQIWGPISAMSYVARLREQQRPLMMISGKYDPTCPAELSRELYREFDRLTIPYRATWLPCGHYTMGVWPFNLVVAFRVLAFLLQIR